MIRAVKDTKSSSIFLLLWSQGWSFSYIMAMNCFMTLYAINIITGSNFFSFFATNLCSWLLPPSWCFLIAQWLTSPLAISSAPGGGLSGSQYNGGHNYDTTGQIAPPGMKPRVTATLWEDEGSLCFQVEAKGVCVARREGKVNHYCQRTPIDWYNR